MQCTYLINIVTNSYIKIFNIVSMCMFYMQLINDKCGMGPLFSMILMKLKLKNTKVRSLNQLLETDCRKYLTNEEKHYPAISHSASGITCTSEQNDYRRKKLKTFSLFPVLNKNKL